MTAYKSRHMSAYKSSQHTSRGTCQDTSRSTSREVEEQVSQSITPYSQVERVKDQVDSSWHKSIRRHTSRGTIVGIQVEAQINRHTTRGSLHTSRGTNQSGLEAVFIQVEAQINRRTTPCTSRSVTTRCTSRGSQQQKILSDVMVCTIASQVT